MKSVKIQHKYTTVYVIPAFENIVRAALEEGNTPIGYLHNLDGPAYFTCDLEGSHTTPPVQYYFINGKHYSDKIEWKKAVHAIKFRDKLNGIIED